MIQLREERGVEMLDGVANDAACYPGMCHKAEYCSSHPHTMLLTLQAVGVLGIVNERLTCCKFVSLLQVVPAYCQKFYKREGLVDLMELCTTSWTADYHPARLQRRDESFNA
ncbi:unnamed protein product, partial [Amoebophrya sp. A120]